VFSLAPLKIRLSRLALGGDSLNPARSRPASLPLREKYGARGTAYGDGQEQLMGRYARKLIIEALAGTRLLVKRAASSRKRQTYIEKVLE
jgi:hypothetical protein